MVLTGNLLYAMQLPNLLNELTILHVKRFAVQIILWSLVSLVHWTRHSLTKLNLLNTIQKNELMISIRKVIKIYWVLVSIFNSDYDRKYFVTWESVRYIATKGFYLSWFLFLVSKQISICSEHEIRTVNMNIQLWTCNHNCQ